MKRILTQFDYINELSLTEIETLAGCITPIFVDTGQYIFHLSDPAESLYLLISGVVKMTYGNPRGDEAPIGFFQTGDIFGHLFLGKYRFRVGSAMALSSCHLGRLSEADFAMLVDQYPRIGMAFLRLMSDYQRETLARLHALMHVDARARLLGALLNFARHWCCNHGDWFQMPASLTQADIATIAGLNRTTASLLINELRRDGILGGRGRTLTINLPAVRNILESQGLEILE
ncbi:MAG: Crp/Fnr family transcriptional regulator [Anaerolineae bacterium]|jgi:CRP-like cAMP-binding protein|nr:Crp/Fnr family transcriptional regulator [Anaerolineae bacterium]